MATCKICSSDKPRFGACPTCRSNAIAEEEARALAAEELKSEIQAKRQADQEARALEDEKRKKERQEMHNASVIRNSVKHLYDEFSARHFIEGAASASFASEGYGRLDGHIEVVIQTEFTVDLETDLVLVGFRRTGQDWRWLTYLNDQLFFILEGSALQAGDLFTNFQVVDGGVFEFVGFHPTAEQVELMISDKGWRARAGLWETTPRWPTHEVFQEALNRKAAILRGDSPESDG